MRDSPRQMSSDPQHPSRQRKASSERSRLFALRRLGLLGVTIVAVAIGSYLYGLYSYPRGLWPASALRGIGDSVRHPGTNDDYGRLVAYPGKISVACPAQTANTAVLLAIGQSNVANHAARRVTTRYGRAVLNYFDGTCHIAASPLLGASSNGGEFLTLLGDRLVDHGLYRNVVVVSSGIGGSKISRWAKGGDLNAMLIATLSQVAKDYRVTHVLWHQGESDHASATTSDVYEAAFGSLVTTLTANGVDAPIYLSITSRCGTPWSAVNPVAKAQRRLVDERRVFLAADTDTLLESGDRYDDCHFAESGQAKVAAAYAAAIKGSRPAR
jgi:carbohydrate esterase-like sialic acid-specific acetylesterase